MMQEKEAKTVFDMGGFSKAMIVPTPMGSGFRALAKRAPKSWNGSVEAGGFSPPSMRLPTQPTALVFAASR